MSRIKVFKPSVPYKPSLNTPSIQQKDFSSTLLDWALKNREQIFLTESITTTEKTLYTVPLGKVLYITSCWLSGQYSGATAGNLSLWKRTDNSDVELFLLRIYLTSGTSRGGLTISYPLPIKVVGGESIRAQSETAVLGMCGFVGFLDFF